jgi:threonine dehydrogenase-like Zn-dependent dehydrogenase
MGEAMRAAFFEADHRMTVREAPVPEPGPEEVRLRVRYCGICGSDLSLYKTGVWSGPDVILGHEISAVVDVDPAGTWAPGARVVPYPAGRGCGECVWCREGKVRYCLNPPPGQHGGGFAELLTVPRSSLIAVPDDLDDRAASLAEPLGVALRGVAMANPRPGDLAYVSGLGPIGLFAAAGLAAAGCRVVGADPREDRRARGLEVGCDVVLDPRAEDPIGAAMALDPHGPRIALECAGAPDSLQGIFDVCGHGGVVGILGIPMAPVFLLRMTLKEQRAHSIQGPSPESMRAALDLLRERPRTATVITGAVPLEETDRAFAGLVEGSGGVKVLVAPGS